MSNSIRKGIEILADSGTTANLFLTPAEKMESSNYVRAFNKELEKLGEGRDDEAVVNAKRREPKGFEATMKWASISNINENDE